MLAREDVHALETLVERMSSDLDAFDIPRALFAVSDITSRRRLAEEEETKQCLDTLQYFTETLPALAIKLLTISSHAERKRATAASAFVPIHTLTPELIGDCFCAGIPNDVALRPGYAKTLSQVCGSWRAVAINRSELWTTLVATWGENYAKICALRAKDRPLDVILVPRPRYRWSLDHWILCGGFSPFQRWRSLELEGHVTYFIWEIFSMMVPHLAHLRFLRFRLPLVHSVPSNMLQSATPLTKHLPGVRSLHLGTLIAPLSFVLSPNLTDIRLEVRVPRVIAGYILHVCPSLEQLRLLGGISRTNVEIRSEYGIVGPGPESLEAAPSLHTFIAAELLPGDALHVVSELKAPGLRHFALFAAISRDLGIFKTKGEVNMHEDMPNAILMLLLQLPELRSISLKMGIEVIEHFASAMSEHQSILALEYLEDIAFAAAIDGRLASAQNNGDAPAKQSPLLYPCIKEHLESFLVTRASGSQSGKALKRISLDALGDFDVVELEQTVWEVYVDSEPSKRWL